MDHRITEGGCFCGAVRYRASGDAVGAAYCHCRTCRKTSGAPVTAWAMFPRAGFSFTAGKPIELRSSDHVTRMFCGKCGTPLTCQHDDDVNIDLTCSSLDEPERIEPKAHIWTSHSIPWVRFDDHLPHMETVPAPKPKSE
jgi:hypothetical protein